MIVPGADVFIVGAGPTGLMLAEPSMIKRPVLDLGDGKLLVGFKPDAYAAATAARN